MATPKGAQPLTLEQVYQMQSDWKAYVPAGSRMPRSAPIVLTALAQQACKQEGIDPRDLQYREIWQFAEPNVSEEIQLMRHAAFMQVGIPASPPRHWPFLCLCACRCNLLHCVWLSASA